MTKNELIVESCRNMAFQDLRDTLSAALDNRDATIAELRADVERLKEQTTIKNATIVGLESETRILKSLVVAAENELTQLREDRRAQG